jgi:hypothetical protein
MADLGDAVALYGAVLATFVGLRQWRHDRNPLAMSLEAGGEGFWLLRIVNRGPNAVTIDSAGVDLGIDFRRADGRTIGASRFASVLAAERMFRIEPGHVFEAPIDESSIHTLTRPAPPAEGAIIDDRGPAPVVVGLEWFGEPVRRLAPRLGAGRGRAVPEAPPPQDLAGLRLRVVHG